MASLQQEFGQGYLFPWGYITHAETINLETSKVNSGTIADYRRRGYTHTLDISGTLLFAGSGKNIIEQKNDLVLFFNTMKGNASNFLPLINSQMRGIYPSLTPEVDDQTIFEPVSLTFQDGTLIDQLKYSCQFAIKVFPTSSEIEGRMIFIPDLGVDLWDGSSISVNRIYNRQTREIKRTLTVSASIQCPNQMPWTKALQLIDTVESLKDQMGDQLTNISYDRNFDAQTVNYNITSDFTDDGGDSTVIIKMFGYDFPVMGNFRLNNEDSLLPDIANKTKPVSNNNFPISETLSYSLSLNAPEDIGFAVLEPGTVQLTILQIHTNMQSLRPGMYVTGLESLNPPDVSNWHKTLDSDPENLWEIISADSGFDPVNKTLQVNITARRSRNVNLRKTFSITGSPFLWEGTSLNYSNSLSASDFIFKETLAARGDFLVPRDMSYSQAQELVNEINNFEDFDPRWEGYRLINKAAEFNRVSKVGNFALTFEKIDLYSFFEENGQVRHVRGCLWSYDVFGGVDGIQIEAEYNRSAQIDESGKSIISLSFSATIRQDPRSYIENNSAVENALNALWTKFVLDKTKLGNGLFRISSASNSWSSGSLSGSVNLSFTDDGKSDESNRRYLDFYGIHLVDAKINITPANMRRSNITDGFSDGDVTQVHGFGLVTIRLNGRVEKDKFSTLQNHTIYASDEYRQGYLYISGYLGRLEELSISDIDPSRETASVSASISVQPKDIEIDPERMGLL